MRTLVSGLIAAVVLGVISGIVLRSVGEPAYVASTPSSVRVGEPGVNLVGRDWTGAPRVDPAGRAAETGTRAGSPE